MLLGVVDTVLGSNENSLNTVNSIEVTVQFQIPVLDLRGYTLCHFEVESWFLNQINYHREQYGVYPYLLYAPAVVTAIEHSLDMRDNNFGGNISSDGRTHQQRHDRWMGAERTRVTSSFFSSYWIEGVLTEQAVIEIVEEFLSRERTRYFVMNPSYRYIGIGFSIQENGRGRLNIVMATAQNERESHWLRTCEQRTEHRQAELERIRQEKG